MKLYLIGAVIATLLSSYGLHSLRMMYVNWDHAKDLVKQASTLNEQFRKQQAITYEVSDEYQKKLSALNKRVSDLKRMYNGACVPVTSNASGRRDAGASAGKLLGAHGISDQWLIEFSAEAEKVRQQLIACQTFIRRERE
jgi:hypothetical protein